MLDKRAIRGKVQIYIEGKLVNDYKSKKAWLVALNKKLSVLK